MSEEINTATIEENKLKVQKIVHELSGISNHLLDMRCLFLAVVNSMEVVTSDELKGATYINDYKRMAQKGYASSLIALDQLIDAYNLLNLLDGGENELLNNLSDNKDSLH
jgi:hypothetical protein